jgi:nitroreductase
VKVYDAILARRSIRRFQKKSIDSTILKKLVNAARFAPSGANLQPLEYVIVNDTNKCADVFDTLSWAGYLKPEWKPEKNERPTAYIVLIVKKEHRAYYKWDAGLAAENIMLAAEDEGLGTCMLLKIKREVLRAILSIPLSHFIDSVIALGYKAELPVVETIKDSVAYWRDEQEVLHVPKRNLEDILHVDRF